MSARSSAGRGGWEVRERSRGEISGGGGWKASTEVQMLSRVEQMRQQYLAGTLFIDEQAVARRILLRVLAW